MNALKLTPIIISLLLLSAHFFRVGLFPLVALCSILPVLLFVQRGWIARLIQTLLVIGSIEWVRTSFTLATERQAVGQPWTRLVIILGLVALFTGLSALVFQCRSLRERYKLSNMRETLTERTVD